jgi:hypothetical protein
MERTDEKPSASLIGLALVMRLSGVSSTRYAGQKKRMSICTVAPPTAPLIALTLSAQLATTVEFAVAFSTAFSIKFN